MTEQSIYKNKSSGIKRNNKRYISSIRNKTIMKQFKRWNFHTQEAMLKENIIHFKMGENCKTKMYEVFKMYERIINIIKWQC